MLCSILQKLFAETMTQDVSTDVTAPDVTGEIIHDYVPKENIKNILYACRRDTLFCETNGGKCISHSYISGRVTCLLLPKLVASVKKQPSVSYYKSPADVSVI